jgi:hypothetical protein
MPNPAQTNTGTSGGTAQTTQPARTQGTGGAIVPFRRATREHRELVNDSTYTLTTGTQTPTGGAISVPAYGYLRGLLITVVVSGGVAGTAFTANAPFNILQNIQLTEPNGAPIVQLNDGFQLYLVNKYFGNIPAMFCDPKGGIYTATLPNFQFQLYIPLELDLRDGLGSLPNQNAAAMFQLRYQVAPSSTLYTTTPTTQPTVQVTVEAMEYDQPQAQTDGNPNQTTPPAMNTTQFLTVQTYPVVSGYNRIRHTRVGNYLRNLGLIFTDGAGSRTVGETNFPATNFEIDLDARPVDYIRKLTWRNTIFQRYGYSGTTFDGAVNTQDSGVFPYDLCHEFDGAVGNENRDGWWKTYGSTRLEFAGNFGVAGTLTVITNDVAIAGNVFLN